MLKAEALAVFRGERLIFRDLSFTVPEGGALVLAGANGAGKSTLLRLLAGLIRPIAGEMRDSDSRSSASTSPLVISRFCAIGASFSKRSA